MGDSNVRRLPVPGMARGVAHLFEAVGAPPDIAKRMAVWMVNGGLSGHTSHGVEASRAYIRQILEGATQATERPTVVDETATTLILDGRLGFGYLCADEITRLLAAKAQVHAVAIGTAINCNHIGRLGEWVELAAELGVLMLLSVAGSGVNARAVAPYGGIEGRLHTNPWAFAAPSADGTPLMLDVATSAVAGGKVRIAGKRGEQVPEGWIIDRDGKPTTDPTDFLARAGGALLTFGGHKGYGLSLMAEIMACNLTGVSAIDPPRLGLFAMALSPAAFGDGQAFLEATAATLARMRATRPTPGFDAVLVPGDLERGAHARNAALGIELPEPVWTDYLDLADEVGVGRAVIKREIAAG